MLETLIVILIIFYLLGVGTGVTLGGLIHLLLIVLIVLVVVRLAQGRPPI